MSSVESHERAEMVKEDPLRMVMAPEKKSRWYHVAFSFELRTLLNQRYGVVSGDCSWDQKEPQSLHLPRSCPAAD